MKKEGDAVSPKRHPPLCLIYLYSIKSTTTKLSSVLLADTRAWQQLHAGRRPWQV